MGKDFFIADIHGRYDELQMLLESINFNYQVDRLFATGDIIDRGPKSYQCLKLLKEPWFFSTLGNHENFLLEAYRGSSYWKALWLGNGGEWSLELTEEEICDAASSILKYQPLSLTVETQYGNLGIVHAECPFDVWPITLNKELNDTDINSIINGRDTLEKSNEKITRNVRCIISGHSEVEKPVILGNQVFMNIQAGSEYSNLTICEIWGNELVFYSNNNEEYKNIRIPSP